MAEFQGHLFPRNLGVTSVGGGGVTSINGDATPAQTFTVGTAGADFNISDGGGGSHVWNLPTASAVNRGALASADWTTFNSKQTGSASLTALAALAGTGYITQTGANTFAERTLTGTVNQVIITNGNGVAGNTVFALPQDIATISTPQFAEVLINASALGIGRATFEANKTFTDFTANNFGISLNLTANQLANGTNNLVGIQSFVQTTAANTHTLNGLIGEYMNITNTQNVGSVSTLTGIQMAVTNTSTLVGNTITGIQMSLESDPVAGTLGNITGVNVGVTAQGIVTEIVGFMVESPFVAVNATNTYGVFISDQSTALASGTLSYGIEIDSQSNNATTVRAINLNGTGVNNAIRFGASANAYANAANNIRYTDSTNAGGIDFNLTTTIPSINTTIANAAVYLALQNQTFTPGATHEAVRIIPTWTAANFTFRGLYVNPTQQGTNTQTLIGYSVLLAQTGAGTLTSAQGIEIQSPTQVGTITNMSGMIIQNQSLAGGTTSYGINIASQTANATTTAAIFVAGTGIANSIIWGNSARQYANAAQNIRFIESTNTGGLDFNLTTTSATINTVTQNNASIILQNQTFTPGALHRAVQITPTWTTESIQHFALSISPTQNGANGAGIAAIDITMTKATAATTVTQMDGIRIETPVVTGTVTRSNGITIQDQTNANVTTSRAISLGTGAANSIIWSAGGIMFSNVANNLRLSTTNNGGGIDFNMVSGGNQTITTFSGNLNMSSTTGVITMTAAREEWALGANVAAANNLTLGTDGNAFTITGNTQINAITVANWQAGSLLILEFTGTPTIKHNTAGGAGTAPIFLAGSVDLAAANNTILGLIYDGTQFQEAFRKAA